MLWVYYFRFLSFINGKAQPHCQSGAVLSRQMTLLRWESLSLSELCFKIIASHLPSIPVTEQPIGGSLQRANPLFLHSNTGASLCYETVPGETGQCSCRVKRNILEEQCLIFSGFLVFLIGWLKWPATSIPKAISNFCYVMKCKSAYNVIYIYSSCMHNSLPKPEMSHF